MSHPESSNNRAVARGPVPVCKAFILAGTVGRESDTGLVSCRNILFGLPRVNGRVQTFAWYAQLIGGLGECGVGVALHDKNENTIYEQERPISIEFGDKLQLMPVGFTIESMAIPKAGIYHLVLYANGCEVERQRLEVRDYQESRVG